MLVSDRRSEFNRPAPKLIASDWWSGSDRRSLSLTLTLSLILPDLNLTIFPSIPCLVSAWWPIWTYNYPFWKRYMLCTIGCGAKPPVAGEFLRFFVLKVTLVCNLQKKIGGAGCVTCSPNNFVGEQLPCSHDYDFGSGTDPISPFILLLFFFLLVGVMLFNKSPRLRRFKSDQDEIWQDCSESKYVSIDSVRFLILRWHPPDARCCIFRTSQ